MHSPVHTIDWLESIVAILARCCWSRFVNTGAPRECSSHGKGPRSADGQYEGRPMPL